MSNEEKPTCAVRGMLGPRAMCGSIIVGLKYCGYSGECEHKQPPAAPEVQNDQAGEEQKQ